MEVSFTVALLAGTAAANQWFHYAKEWCASATWPAKVALGRQLRTRFGLRLDKQAQSGLATMLWSLQRQALSPISCATTTEDEYIAAFASITQAAS